MNPDITLLLPLATRATRLVEQQMDKPPAPLRPVVAMGRFLDVFGVRLFAQPDGRLAAMERQS